MIRTLQDHGIHQGIDVHMECTVTRLSKTVSEAVRFGYSRGGKFMVFKAKAVVMATGGIGRAYKVTSNSWEYTGDGQTLAYDAGAELIDMEFVQFHPTGMVWPPSVRGILVTEGVRGRGNSQERPQRPFYVSRHSDNYKARPPTLPRKAGATLPKPISMRVALRSC
ncbi:MAG: FAD-binding protein [Pirellulaceae bacterium]